VRDGRLPRSGEPRQPDDRSALTQGLWMLP
jgi:hypothetical protein